jgi:hypothetical protein
VKTFENTIADNAKGKHYIDVTSAALNCSLSRETHFQEAPRNNNNKAYQYKQRKKALPPRKKKKHSERALQKDLFSVLYKPGFFSNGGASEKHLYKYKCA